MAVLNREYFPYIDGLQYNTDQGVIVPYTSDIKQSIETEFTSNDMFGGDFDTTEENIGGRLIEGATRLMTEVLGMCAVNSNQLNFEYALGRYLDVHASFYGLSRNAATATTVKCTLGGSANLVIPKGSVVEDGDGVGYVLTSDTILNDQGYGEGVFACEIKGKREVAAGTIKTIRSTSPLSWDTVSNENSQGITGQDIESDDSLRNRIRIARKSGIGFLNGIYAKIMAIPEVKECLVYENCYSNPIYVNSSGTFSPTYVSGSDIVPVKPHSIYVVADYEESADTDYNVAEAIYKTKSCGSGMTPSYTYNTAVDYTYEKDSCHIPVAPTLSDYGTYVKNIQYLDTGSQSYYTVLFNKPFMKWASVEVSVSKNNYIGSASELRTAIINAVRNYKLGKVEKVDGLKIGQNMLAFELSAAVSDEIPEIQVKSVAFIASGNTRPSSPFIPGLMTGDTANEIQVKFSHKGEIETDGPIDIQTRIDGVIVTD